MELPNCPTCNSAYTYQDGDNYICPECAYEWISKADKETINNETIMDSNNNVLNDGDDVIVIKDLKVKGSSAPVKKGTKVKNIKLIHNPSDGHDIDCKIDGFGAIRLKSEYVKKA
ncbi:MAG: alkylphosphonate utilization protein [Syntrophomonadaceae bacterium]|nr:alkylphosphonate utilization protein [Syntrophomonadaceae bacterium]